MIAFEPAPKTGNEAFDAWMERFVDDWRAGEVELSSIVITGSATINNYRLGQIGSWEITESAITNGTIVIDAAANRITVDSIILDGTENEIRIGGSGLILDADNQRLTALSGDNYVRLDTTGLLGVDSVLGTTFRIYNDGTAPLFANGTITEAEYQVYETGVMKTSSDPQAYGGLIINNIGLTGYDETPKKVIQLVYSGDNKGDAYIGDYDSGNAGIKYDHSAGTLNLRGSFTISGNSAITNAFTIGSGGYIRTSTAYPYLELSQNGIQLKTADDGGTYGTAEYGTDLYGSGALAMMLSPGLFIPYFENKEPEDGSSNTMASLHLYNRSSDPTGAATVGDIAVVSGILKICTSGGTPGTWTQVGDQVTPP